LSRLLDRVLAGDEVTITRHGQPVAVVVRPDALRVRRPEKVMADAEVVGEMLERARRTPLPEHGSMTADRAEELVAEVRAGRASR
jgi:prevent-host-death family protein